MPAQATAGPRPGPQAGNVLLLMIGIITVMLVFAFGFLRSVQMARGSAQVQRQQRLAGLAAEMGVEHAVAVCLHGYAMSDEIGDPDPLDGKSVHGLQTARSRVDSPIRNVFNMLSPRVSSTVQRQQPPTAWDLPPDISFNDLYMGFSGVYRPRSGYKTVTVPTYLPGYSTGWTMQRGYGRYTEANRFDFSRNSVYDPSTYDAYDLSPLASVPPVMPTASVVQTPFPPVDPFVRGSNITRRHVLDNPLLLDAEYRPLPVAQAAAARYRLRYVVSTYDQSPVIWLNTDPSWLQPAEKTRLRDAYREAVYSIGEQWAWSTIGHTTGGPRRYGPQMEAVLLGYGQYGNVRFDGVDGKPKEWASRGGANTGYRFSDSANAALANVHGSPFMNWFDGGAWRGAAITSWNDLGFAIRDCSVPWNLYGETGSASWANDESLMRADPVSHHALTPFGRPYEGATQCPWQVNALTAPMQVLSAIVGSYMPPATRRTYWNHKGIVFLHGRGSDLFTDSFKVGGVSPFVDNGGKVRHSTPANRDYWISTPALRPDATQPDDVRPNVAVSGGVSEERYPGGLFYEVCGGTPAAPVSLEQSGRKPVLWRNIAMVPPQATDDPAGASLATTLNTAIQANGSINGYGLDHLGRHIVFYTDSSNTTDKPKFNAWANSTTNGIFSAVWNSSGGLVTPWTQEFSPLSPFAIDTTTNSWETPSIGAGGGPQSFYPYLYYMKDHYWTAGAKLTAPNSYWSRVSVAFMHAVLVSQIANLAHSDPSDARNSAYWPADGYTNPTSDSQNNDAAGIIYNPNPHGTRTATKVMRKGTKDPAKPAVPVSWDPRAAHFSTLEQIDRQFLANLGESFDTPGIKRTSQVRLQIDPTTGATRPARFSRCVTPSGLTVYTDDQKSGPSPSTFAYGSSLWVGEYLVSNNIRTLLLPVAGADPPARGVGSLATPPPNNLWLLDEWNALSEPGYVPGTSATGDPTPLARTRAKLMERMLNDWRMSFLGASKAYADDFRPKDFDGDGRVFCSGYMGATTVDADTQLTCWQSADADGNGPGDGRKSGDPAYVSPTTSNPALRLTLFSLTGSLALPRSHQFKILVRGELFDNIIGKPVAEKYLETALLVDPDNNVVRSTNPATLPAGLTDSTIIMQRPVHNYYRGFLAGSNP